MDGVDRPGIGVDPGRDVDRHHARAAALRLVHGGDRGRLRSRRRPREPAAEHRVDHHVGARELRSHRTEPGLGSRERIAAQLLPRRGDHRDRLRAELLTQQARRHEAVAAVVPGPAVDGDCARPQREHFPRHRRARALHQRAGGQTQLGSQPIQLALLGGGEEPHARPGLVISSFMSRTARSSPTRTARQTIAYPILSSPISSIRATAVTFQ